jgi:hypothetical protein
MDNIIEFFELCFYNYFNKSIYTNDTVTKQTITNNTNFKQTTPNKKIKKLYKNISCYNDSTKINISKYMFYNDIIELYNSQNINPDNIGIMLLN